MPRRSEIRGQKSEVDPQITQTRLPLPRLPRVAKHCGQGGTSGQVDADYEKEEKNKDMRLYAVDARGVYVKKGTDCLTQSRKGAKAQRKYAYYPHGIGESLSERLFEKGLFCPQ